MQIFNQSKYTRNFITRARIPQYFNKKKKNQLNQCCEFKRKCIQFEKGFNAIEIPDNLKQSLNSHLIKVKSFIMRHTINYSYPV